jgi:TonB family protein
MSRVAFLLLLLLAGRACAGTDEAMAFYEKGQYEQAYAEFMQLAEIGEREAQFNIGVMYFRGQHVAADRIQAYAWMALAAEGGTDPRMTAALADVSRQFGHDELAEAERARQALFARYSTAALAALLAPDATQGAGNAEPLRAIKRTPAVVPASLRSIRGSVLADVMFTVAPDGTTRNYTVIASGHPAVSAAAIDMLRHWQYEPPMVAGKPVEVYGERVRVTISEGPDIDVRRARLLVTSGRAKADAGTPADRYGFAYLLESLKSHKEVGIDPAESNRWYLSAAQQGFAPAQFALGKNLLIGKACAADAAKSARWLERAAAQGQPDAQYLLATEMLSGARMGRNPAGAVKWLQRSADRNNQHAQLKLAWLYAAGADETLRNAALAKEYLDKVDDEYPDRLTLFETRAAVAAALGDFNGAAKWQEKAVSEAERYELPLPGFAEKLAAYKDGKPWLDPA